MNYPRMAVPRAYTVSVDRLDGGLDLSFPPERVEDNRLTACDNVYFKDGFLRTRPGFYTDEDRVLSNDRSVEEIRQSADGRTVVARIGNRFLFLDADGRKVGACDVGNPAYENFESGFFAEETADTMLYFANTGRIFRVSLTEHTSTSMTESDCYMPLYFTNGRPVQSAEDASPGTTAEGFNLLTNWFRAAFTTDESSGAYFSPPVKAGSDTAAMAEYTGEDGTVYTFSVWVQHGILVNASEGQTVTVGGESKTLYLIYTPRRNAFFFAEKTTVDGSEGYNPFALPHVGFSNNLVFTIYRDAPKDDTIFRMRCSTWFGGDRSGVMTGTRLFVGGNGNLVRYSDVDNPLYFPENSFMKVGDGSTRVTAFGRQSSALVIFKERELYFCEYAYREVNGQDVTSGTAVDVTQTAYFPLTQLSASVGCDLPDTIVPCGGRLVWATTEGRVYTLTSFSNYTDKSVRVISYPVESTLQAADMSRASAARYDGQYVLMTGREFYLFDCDGYGFANFSSYASAKDASKRIPWYRWTWDAPDWFPSRLTGCGEHAFFFGWTAFTTYRMRTFTVGGETDTVISGSDEEEKPVRASFATKLFEFGDPIRRKAVHAMDVSVGIGGDDISVAYISDRKQEADVYRLPSEPNDPIGGDIVIRRVTPHMTRVRTFGVRFSCEGVMRIAGFRMNIRYTGEVRT